MGTGARFAAASAVLGMLLVVAANSGGGDGGEFAEAAAAKPSGDPAVRLFDEAYGEAAAAMRAWDPSFEAPEVVWYDGPFELDGASFDDDGAAWYDGRLYIDAGAFVDGGAGGEAEYVAGHEMGHQWEAYGSDRYLTGRAAESYAECVAGAVAAAAGWDVRELEGYTATLESDGIHGTPSQRRSEVAAGAAGGPRRCLSYAR